MEDKREIRREVRRRISELTAEARTHAAREIFDAIEALPHFAEARCIALFASMPDEVTTEMVLPRWRAMGRRLAVPRVEGEVMRFYEYDPAHMSVGSFGIAEPTDTCEVQIGDIDMMIVPARAFTPEGLRLGRGGGFYDKYMSAATFRAYKVGICYRCQLFATLPHDPHDIAVDRVIAR